ncbi:MAG TPA: TonB-dependent receptor, partial [Gammaproteobacteria bacterium]|nr:TonB-dependent receptor [Gammaproteobacteria bacterium]
MISVAKGATAASTPVLARALGVAALAAIGVGAAEVAMPVAAEDGTSLVAESPEEITVTARRREETAQDVPIPVSVLSGELVNDTGSFNVNRVKELIPTVQ